MKEYTTECYIAAKDSEPVLFENYFSDKDSYNKWVKAAEERALSEFYNREIKMAVNYDL